MLSELLDCSECVAGQRGFDDTFYVCRSHYWLISLAVQKEASRQCSEDHESEGTSETCYSCCCGSCDQPVRS